MKQIVAAVHTHTHTQVNLINKLIKINIKPIQSGQGLFEWEKMFLANNKVRDG